MKIILEEKEELIHSSLKSEFLFNNYIWYKTLKESTKDLKVGFLNKNEELLPFGYKKKLFFYFFYFSPLTTPYDFKENLDFDIFFQKYKNILFIEIVDFKNKLALSKNFLKIPTFYHYIDLHKTTAEIEKSYKKSLREQIRQAKRKGVSFRKMEKKDLMKFYDIYCKLRIKKFKIAPYPFAFFEKIFDNLIPERAEGFVAEVNGKVATGLICLHVNKDFCLAFVQGTDPDFYSCRVSPFIFDNTIKYYKDKGFKIFSFGLTPLQSKGTLFFKESFGCEKQDITIWRFVHPLYKLGKKLLKFKLVFL